MAKNMDGEDYDAVRRNNIAERNSLFAEFFKDLKKETDELKAQDVELHGNQEGSNEEENEPPRKRHKSNRRKRDGWTPREVRLEFRKKYNTRLSAKMRESCMTKEDLGKVDESKKPHKGPKLKVLFPWAIPFEREIRLMRADLYGEEIEEHESQGENDSSDEEEDGKNRVVHRVPKSEYTPDDIPSPDEITEEQLLNVADRSSGKTYCKVNGTSCHQCRQKTLDTKTVCRSGECVGVRGQFCGPCLRGRYGEYVTIALKDAYWVCPPCRGLCNCSICRTRNGQRPTGILAPVVQEEGFSSVMDYLESGSTIEP